MPRRGRRINSPSKIEQAKKKADFLDAFERTATIDGAARAIGIARQTHYQWMAKDPDYAVAYARADEVATERLEQEARRRAMIGTEEPVFHGGKEVGKVRKYSDVLLIFLLKARRPETYRERFEHRIDGRQEPKPLVIDLVTDRDGLASVHVEDARKGKRLVVHPGQAQVLQGIARDRIRFPVVVAGRRWGKTELACLCLIRACLSEPGLYRYIAPTAVLARRTAWRRKLRRAIHPSWWASPPNETRMEYTFRNGSILEVMGAEDPVGLLGEGVSGIVLDEYASMKGDVWTEYVLPSLADTEGWALFIGSPKSFNHFHAVYELGQNDDRPEWGSWQFRSLDNPLISPEVVQQAREVTDPRTFRQEWEASFETIAGRTYYAFSRHDHVGPVSWDPNLPARVAFDFNVEPATATLGQTQGDRAVVWREVYLSHRGGEATKASAMAVSGLLEAAGHRGEVRIYGDATGKSAKTTGPSDHAVLRQVFEGGTWCIGRRNPHEKDRIAAVNAVCENELGQKRLLVDPACKHLIADLEQVIMAPDGSIDKKSNPDLTHISDAFGYWIVRDYPTVVKTPVGLARIEHLL